MIEKLMTNSRVTEVSAVAVRAIGAYNNTGLGTDTHLAGIFASISDASSKLTQAINRSKAGSILEEKDEVRDQQFRGLFYLVQGFLHHPTPAVQEAAVLVNEALGRYGLSVVSESYATESSLISSLLADLSGTGLQAAIAALPGCVDMVSGLQSAQAEFETARIAYEEEKGEESTPDNATAIKKEVVKLINGQLVVYLRAMVQVDEATYGGFSRTLAEIIDDNNEVVRKRSKSTAAV